MQDAPSQPRRSRPGGHRITASQAAAVACLPRLRGGNAASQARRAVLRRHQRPSDSLSTALKYLRQHPAALELQSKSVATKVECDARLLLNDLEKNDLTALVGRYRGPFLATLDLNLNEELAEWVYVTREFLARSVRGALLRLAELEAAQGRVVRGAREAERAYTLAGAPELEPEEIRANLRAVGSWTEFPRRRPETGGGGGGGHAAPCSGEQDERASSSLPWNSTS